MEASGPQEGIMAPLARLLQRADGSPPPVVVEAMGDEIESPSKKRRVDGKRSGGKARSLTYSPAQPKLVDNSGLARKNRPTMKRGPLPTQVRMILDVRKVRSVVNHSYRDFSHVPTNMATDGFPTSIAEMSFSQKVHYILSKEEYDGCVSWMPHGRAFRVNVPKLFEKVIMRKYFGHGRYSSFLCELNNHGFKHITQGLDRNCYYHECFLRGLPHLLKYMPKPKNARRLTPDPENEPNFYLISQIVGVPDHPTEAVASLPQAMSPSYLQVGPMRRMSPTTSELGRSDQRLSSVFFTGLGAQHFMPRSFHGGSSGAVYENQGLLGPTFPPHAAGISTTGVGGLIASLPLPPTSHALRQQHAAALYVALGQAQEARQAMHQPALQGPPLVVEAAVALAGLHSQSSTSLSNAISNTAWSPLQPGDARKLNATADLQRIIAQFSQFPGHFGGI